jgi:hypothetical protein
MHPRHYVRGHSCARQHASPIPRRGNGRVRGAALAIAIGLAAAATLFLGLSGGFRP